MALISLPLAREANHQARQPAHGHGSPRTFPHSRNKRVYIQQPGRQARQRHWKLLSNRYFFHLAKAAIPGYPSSAFGSLNSVVPVSNSSAPGTMPCATHIPVPHTSRHSPAPRCPTRGSEPCSVQSRLFPQRNISGKEKSSLKDINSPKPPIKYLASYQATSGCKSLKILKSYIRRTLMPGGGGGGR